MDLVAFALSKKYTNDTADALGAVKGSPCTIKSAVHQNGRTTITFEWKGYSGQTEETQITVLDGTPIYEWQSGDQYNYSDLVIYASCFYRCITPNSDIEFDDTKWNEIGSPDGNYDIVQNSSLLPSIFTSADRKMYYSIEDQYFYLWNGTQWVAQKNVVQYTILPIASVTYENKIVQYIGTTNNTYTKGYFYQCVESATPGEYEWQNIKIQDSISTASDVTYDNINSGLEAENVQEAIDEVYGGLGTASSKDVAASGDASTTEVVMGNDSRLTDARTPVAHTHAVSDITDFPASMPASDVYDWAKAVNKPNYNANEINYNNTASAMTADDVQEAIDELAQTSASDAASKTIWGHDDSAGQSDYAKVYKIYQGENDYVPNRQDGKTNPILKLTINIPKDEVLEAASIVTITYNDQDGKLYEGQTDVTALIVGPSGTATAADAGKYLKMTMQNVTDPLYVNLQTFVDVYTVEADAQEVQLVLNDHEFSGYIVEVSGAKLTDATVTKAKLASSVQGSLDLADSAVQTIAEGATNGTVAVDGTDVAVHGLGTAAFTAATAYDAAGAADTAEENVKDYINGPHVELTQSEYDALTPEEKNNGTVYFITDGQYSEDNFVMRLKGIVATYSDLPSNDNKNGDVYHVTERGAEYVWLVPPQGQAGWEELGSVVDLSAYSTTTQMNSAINSAKEDIVGSVGDASLMDTINGAKKYADDLVNNLALRVVYQLPDVTNVTCYGMGSYEESNNVYLRFMTPDDIINNEGDIIAEFGGVRVIRKKDSAPVDAFDGVLVTDCKEKNTSKRIFDTVDQSGTFYYRFFPYTKNGVYTVGQSVSCNVCDLIYGVEWDGSSSSNLSRTDAAQNFTDPIPYYNGMTESPSSPFDNIYPWSEMKVVNDPTLGKLVKIPKFWFKTSISGGVLKVQITSIDPQGVYDGFKIAPAFNRNDDKGIRDYIYIGAYHCGENTFKSESGLSQQTNKTINEVREALSLLGEGVYCEDWYTYFTLRLLFLVEYASFDAQAKIGLGCSSSGTKAVNGQTDSIIYHTGTTASSRNSYGFTKYRNIEGLWDNVLDYLDGVYVSFANVQHRYILQRYHTMDPSKYGNGQMGINGLIWYPEDIISDGKEMSGFKETTFYAYSGGPYYSIVFAPDGTTVTNSNYNTYISDALDQDPNPPYGQNYLLAVGGKAEQSRKYGIFYENSMIFKNGSSSDVGCRLMKLP